MLTFLCIISIVISCILISVSIYFIRFFNNMREFIVDMSYSVDCIHSAVHDAISSAVWISKQPQNVLSAALENGEIPETLYEILKED